MFVQQVRTNVFLLRSADNDQPSSDLMILFGLAIS